MIIRNIKKVTRDNISFRRGLYQDQYSQLMVMSTRGEVPPEENFEIHHGTQYIFIVQGKARVTFKVDKKITQTDISTDDVFIVRPNTLHNIMPLGDEELKFYTIYAPVEHPE